MIRNVLIGLLITIALALGFRYALKDTTKSYKCSRETKTARVTIEAVQPFPPGRALITFSDGHVMPVMMTDIQGLQIGEVGILQTDCENRPMRYNTNK